MNDNVENAVVSIAKWYHRIFRCGCYSDSVKKILVVRFEHLGDMVCTVPFLRELRNNYPSAEITLVCSPEVYNYVELMPYADKIITYKKIISGKHLFERSVISIYKFVQHNFHGINFDMVFTPEYPTPAIVKLFAYFVSAKKVHCFHKKSDDVYITDSMYKGKIFPARHAVDRMLDLLRAVGGKINRDYLEAWYDEDDLQKVKTLFTEAGVSAHRIKLAVFLSTSAAYKDWDVGNYYKVSRMLQEKFNAQIILLGAKSDTEEYGKQFMGMLPTAYNFIGKTTIRQTIAVLDNVDFYLGGDTGTLHLAAACQIPGVVITKDHIGASGGAVGSPMDMFFPWKSPIKVMRPQKPLPGCERQCSKTYAHCINQITPQEVFGKMADIIGSYSKK